LPIRFTTSLAVAKFRSATTISAWPKLLDKSSAAAEPILPQPKTSTRISQREAFKIIKGFSKTKAKMYLEFENFIYSRRYCSVERHG